MEPNPAQFAKAVPTSDNPERDAKVAKILADRRAKALPGTPESRGNWTDKTRLH